MIKNVVVQNKVLKYRYEGEIMLEPTVLIVENDDALLKLMHDYFIKSSFLVKTAKEGSLAIECFDHHKIDLVILDIMLDDLDGWSVLRNLRSKSHVPILMLTARREEADKLFGFELGADDYMTKPFSLKELLARSKALLKRANMQSEDTLMMIGKIKVDLKARKVFANEKEIYLSPKEYELLIYLNNQKSTALSREKILADVWGYQYFGELRTVDTHIKRLRQKIEPLQYIDTVFGVGYRLEVK
jgi:DNA-binding response OmpR family regulator